MVSSVGDVRVSINSNPVTADSVRKLPGSSSDSPILQVEIASVPAMAASVETSVTILVATHIHGVWSANATSTFVYTVVTGSPTLMYAKPLSGSARGGTEVRIVLTNFMPDTNQSAIVATVGGTSATITKLKFVQSLLMLTVVTPVTQTPAAVALVVENSNFPVSRWEDSFQYESVPLTVLYTIPPAAGAGQQVEVVCKNVFVLEGSLSVTVGAVPTAAPTSTPVGSRRLLSGSTAPDAPGRRLLASSVQLDSVVIKGDGRAKLKFTMPSLPQYTSSIQVVVAVSDGSQSSSATMKLTVIDRSAPLVEGYGPPTGSTCGNTLLTVQMENVESVAGSIQLEVPANIPLGWNQLMLSSSSATTEGGLSTLTFVTPVYPAAAAVEMKLHLPAPTAAPTFAPTSSPVGSRRLLSGSTAPGAPGRRLLDSSASTLLGTIPYVFGVPSTPRLERMQPTSGTTNGGTKIIVVITLLEEPQSADGIFAEFIPSTGVADAIIQKQLALYTRQ
jgi:hypothetical protein